MEILCDFNTKSMKKFNFVQIQRMTKFNSLLGINLSPHLQLVARPALASKKLMNCEPKLPLNRFFSQNLQLLIGANLPAVTIRKSKIKLQQWQYKFI